MKEKKSKRKTNSPAPQANTSKKGIKARKATATSKVKSKTRARCAAKVNTEGTAKTKTAKNESRNAEQLKEKAPIVFPKSSYKGTLNTHDIMHAPVEKTIKMLEKIISGERLFTM